MHLRDPLPAIDLWLEKIRHVALLQKGALYHGSGELSSSLRLAGLRVPYFGGCVAAFGVATFVTSTP